MDGDWRAPENKVSRVTFEPKAMLGVTCSPNVPDPAGRIALERNADASTSTVDATKALTEVHHSRLGVLSSTDAYLFLFESKHSVVASPPETSDSEVKGNTSGLETRLVYVWFGREASASTRRAARAQVSEEEAKLRRGPEAGTGRSKSCRTSMSCTSVPTLWNGNIFSCHKNQRCQCMNVGEGYLVKVS